MIDLGTVPLDFSADPSFTVAADDNGAGPHALLEGRAPSINPQGTALNIALAGAPEPDTAFGPEQARVTLLNHFAEAGYGRIEPSILQDATAFLDLGGEDLRAHLFLTSDASGAELCLRPDYTIPACRSYLATKPTGRPAFYAYGGPVFRLSAKGSGEILQAGLESFGRTDIAAADAEILSLTVEAARAAGAPPLAIEIGDAGLVSQFLGAIDLPSLWQRRLRRGLEKGQSLDVILDGAPQGMSDRSGVIAALNGADGKNARALVEDLLSIAGIAAVGGRSVGEIAERFLSQVARQSAPGFDAGRRDLLARFLAIRDDPDRASAAVRALAREAGIDLDPALELIEERTGFMLAHGLDIDAMRFGTAFARNLDYYTGFIFEARAAASPQADVLAGGGRYDRMAEALGSERPVPAVGATIWIERLLAAGAAA